MMRARFRPCEHSRLDQFLHRGLPEEQQKAVEAHLLDCPACQARLDELAGGPRWWSAVRRCLGGEDETSSGDGHARTGAATPKGMGLGFLEPSGEPASLGRLGPYEVLELVGRGGMAAVLKAFDPSLHRLVAIKVLAAEYAASGTARKRFAREAQAAAAVVHDHVVAVYAVDANASPPYLVMAFIPGRSLQQRIDQTGPLELKEILRIGMQTAAGLAAAHAQGLVHRDIKPANIMLENGVERVRITDFGLARAVDDASVTRNGAVAGTPQYMAPEQAGGQAVDQRADLFALGSTLYAMCTGRPPFRGESGMAVLRQVCDAEPEPVRSVNPDVPAWLEGIIRKLHAKQPARRFQSAAEVACLLEGCLAHLQHPGLHPLPRPAEELGRQLSGGGTPVSTRSRLALAAVVLAALGVSLALMRDPQADRRRSSVSPNPAPGGVAASPDEAVADDLYYGRWDDVRRKVSGLRQALDAAPIPEDGGPATSVSRLRQQASQLKHQFYQSAPVSDPLTGQLEMVRQRLEQLRHQLGSDAN